MRTPTKNVQINNETGDFWQFSPVGDVIGLIHQKGQQGVTIDVYNTLDGTSAGMGAQIPSPIQSLQLHSRATSQVATNTTASGGTDYPLGANTAACTASFDAHSPVNILLVDEHGRRTGFDPGTGTVVNEIPGGTFTGIGTEPQTITIPYTAGTYAMNATGLDSLAVPEPYRLTIETANATSSLIDEHELSGVASKETRQQFVVITVDSGQEGGLGRLLFDVAPSTSTGTFAVTFASWPTTSLSDSGGNDIPVTTVLDGQIQIGSEAVPEPSEAAFAGSILLLVAALRVRSRITAAPSGVHNALRG